MNRNAWLGLGLTAVLAAAVIFARTLTEAPGATAARSSPSMESTTASSSPGAAAVEPPAPLAPEAAPAAGPTPAPPAAAAPPPAAPEGSPTPLPDDENPFLAEQSVELDYAFELVFGKASTVETARVAADVFGRCLQQAPDNHRCYRGLLAAQERQLPDWKPPEDPPPGLPSLLRGPVARRGFRTLEAPSGPASVSQPASVRARAVNGAAPSPAAPAAP